ncbi:MAG: cysteine desulfurase [Candidatus Omnitrophica bacterium]|nr:cysteine desulfurase [Candidatus Omnitrophota bacterium]
MPLIYLDHASTTPCDPRVFEAMRPFFFEQGGNPASPHQSGRWARRAVEEARETLAGFIEAQGTEIIFTGGASESNNQAVFSTAAGLKGRGRHIVASAIEHHSVLEPLRRLKREGFEVSLIKPRADGITAYEDIKSVLRTDTILVCLVHANNEIGTLQPVEATGRLCRERGIHFLVDATQTVGHIPVNVKDISCDFLSLSAHKFYGPKGVGALYVRQGIECSALILGGDQERGRRAGTLNTAGIAGLGQALKLCGEEMSTEASRESDLRDRVIDVVLKEIPAAILNGHRNKRLPNNAHFCFDGVNGEELVSALDMAGVAVSMGSACTWGRLEPSHVLKALGLDDRMALGSLRVTVGRRTTSEDIEYFLKQLKLKAEKLRS